MTVYYVKNVKKWRYDFVVKGRRYTKKGFLTKTAAKDAEMEARYLIQHSEKTREMVKMPVRPDMEFRELLALWLEHLQDRRSDRYYSDCLYYVKRWSDLWGKHMSNDITTAMVEKFLKTRKIAISPGTANCDLRLLRAAFNFGLKQKIPLIDNNPTNGVEFYSVPKQIKYVPPKQDILKVISVASKEDQDYLWAIVLTMARVGEINRLEWKDVNFRTRTLHLYTRKKRGGALTPRPIAMGDRLYHLLMERYITRKDSHPWVFWHRYWSKKIGCFVEGPYSDRKKLMKTLCEKAGVKYFRYHPFRHFGASLLEAVNTPISDIQKILGHEKRTTTEIYLHSIGGGQVAAVTKLNSMLE